MNQIENTREDKYIVREIEKFEELNLKDDLLRGIYANGFEYPSTIQKKAILPIIEGRDVIGQAQSGMGKTGTYSIGLLQLINPKLKSPQGIILAHTKELAKQIGNVVNNLSKYLKINICMCVGGTDTRTNISQLRKNPQVIIGTPGRILDMIGRGELKTNYIKLLVIDEADEMLSKGFLEQVKNIFITLPSNVQATLFSATMPPEFLDITREFMRNPVEILVKQEELTLEGIKQFYINVEKNEYKFETLCDIYDILTIAQSMIYCYSRQVVEELSEKLIANNFSVISIHGDMTSHERDSRIEAFKKGTCRVLVSTDMLARGIDIQQVSVVICYDLPKDIKNYLHRIGRSGRFGRKGVAINFVTYNDYKILKDIERYYSIEIEEMPRDLQSISKYL